MPIYLHRTNWHTGQPLPWCSMASSEPVDIQHHRHGASILEYMVITSDSIKLLLKRSKTDRFGKSATVLIGSTSTSTCPVRAMQKFLSIHQREPPGPLFVLQSAKNVTCRLVSEMTQSLLRSAGLNWQCYSSHSYRIGAETTAASAGLPDHLIKTLGRWRSNAYQDYIRTSPKILCRAAQMHCTSSEYVDNLGVEIATEQLPMSLCHWV